jgi:alkane 1-monooxygenase
VWEYEQNRIKQSPGYKWWHTLLFNRLLTFNAAHFLYIYLVYLVFGLRATMFHLVYSAVITLMFEAVNYIEHYGLERKLIGEGVYESVNIMHSWNAPQVFTNYALFKLQRHSDHHANAYKPYQTLDSYVESPMLPYGYSVSLILSMFPPVWKRVIDPMAIATNKGEKVSAEVVADQKRCVFGVLCFTSVVISYVNFYVIGFPKLA